MGLLRMLREPPGGHDINLIMFCMVSFMFFNLVLAEDELMGPVFVKEPPNRVDFSNGTGAEVECQARGNPQPDIIWVRADGTAVGDVPGLRQVLPNGNLVFPPFRAEDYRQEVHAQVYSCLATSPAGSVHSRDVNVRAVVAQYYDTDVNKEYAIRGNSAILKCVVPSFVADFVKILSWHTDQGEEFVPGDDYVVHQYYQSEVNNEYVIRGNSAILKCSIPSFVSEFVQVVGWQDDQGNSFNPNEENVVVQYYEAEVVSEYVIRGNAAILKCTIPSFVAEFVSVESWEGSDGSRYKPSTDYVVAQTYQPEIMTEYVIRGNSAILKCSIPSYIAEFVSIEAWIREDGEVYVPEYQQTDKIPQVVSQFFVTEAENEYVIRANSAIMKCKIPSFVSEFVYVDQWIADDGTIYRHEDQDYVVQQFYESRVIDEFVLRGNTATLKCLVPSFVGDFVDVIEWIADDGTSYSADSREEEVVSQYFEVQVYDVFAIRGNAAIFKCQVPSFVADHVDVDGWIDSAGGNYRADDEQMSYVVGQRYAVNVMDEHVLRGNAAIIKCHIPSFVAEFVEVDSWVEDETTEIYPKSNYDGKYLVLPSGELHIRDVGPEDGYKTYQCRTKHRLTGETRLSATKGRLVITEPVTSTKPKFPMTENSRTYTVRSNEPLTLFCPAQAFPVPAFRTCHQCETKISDDGHIAHIYSLSWQNADTFLSGSSLSRSSFQNQSRVLSQNSQ
ncbi:GSCOCT00004135001.2-RA-CDS [Cotesia congregata]|uniref:Down Syndrome Cell Adhesion Molecule-like protein 5 n=1 Tax=Cotesia congregata TaxID=51543 RepID=A0A8J2HRB6_COTCN|nr:GSCOCT00004135001.2-RA-CDS [Cotesia congregata]CAG5109229.1 Down Syndrome Cell Adhesion Molecule-like protein 5 [Cotesia congregata]